MSATILLAHSDARYRRQVSAELILAGFKVVQAEDGLTALAAGLMAQPELLIADYKLPQLSGVEVCTRLKQAPGGEGRRAVLLTAAGYGLPLATTDAGGIQKILPEPTARELVGVVQGLMQHRLAA